MSAPARARVAKMSAASARAISSTQVIASLKSVVKELVDNSLDAEAGAVDIVFTDSGVASVAVTDNGCGIALDDPGVRDTLVIARSSSKAATAAAFTTMVAGGGARSPDAASPAGADSNETDDGSLTLGFRGEALHSIGTVASLTMISKTADMPSAVSIAYTVGGDSVASRASALDFPHSAGTRVVVSDLFAKIPVRRRQLEQQGRQQYLAAVAVLRQLAVAHPSVRFHVSAQTPAKSGGAQARSAVIFATKGTGDLLNTVADVHGGRFAAALLQFRCKAPGFTIEALVSRLGDGRANNDMQSFSLDGRPIDFPRLASAINECFIAAHPSATNKVPVVFMSLTTAAADANTAVSSLGPADDGQLDAAAARGPPAYDANVAPDKRTAIFANELAIIGAVRRSLLAFLTGSLETSGVGGVERLVARSTSATSLGALAPQQLKQAVATAIPPPAALGHTTPDSAPPVAPPAAAPRRPQLRAEDLFAAATLPSRVSGGVVPTASQVASSVSAIVAEAAARRSGDARMPAPRTPPVETEDVGGSVGAIASEAAQRDASTSSAASTPQRRRGSSIPASERMRREFVPDVAKDDSSLASLDSESDLSGFLVDGSQTDEELPESEAAATPRHAQSVDPDGVADAMPSAQSGQHGGGENVKLPATADRTDGAQLANVDDDGSIAGAGNTNENDEDDTLPAAQAEVYPGLGDTPLRMSELGGTPLGGGDSGGDAGRSASALLPSRQGPIGNSDGAVARTLSFTTQPGASAAAVDEGDDQRGAEEEAIDDFSSPLKSRARCPEWRDVDVPQSVDDWRELPALATAQLPALLASAPAASSKKKAKRGRKQEWAALGSAECEADLRRSFTRADFERMRVLGQFNDGFIAARVGDDFFILDQHASDEKHTYERLKESYVARAQPLLAPIPVVADEDEVEAAYNHADELAAHGFRLAPLPPDSDAAAGPREIRVSAIPVLQYEKVEAADVLQLTRQLKDHGTITTPIRAVWHSLATKACRTSVMIGKPLALPAMERIVRNMVGMDHPWNCPHGRPTMRHVGRAEAGDEPSHDSFMATVPDVTSFLKRHRAEAEAEERALDEAEEIVDTTDA